MICKNCETENADGSVYCKHCGARLDGMRVCPSCEKPNPEGALFCSACGANLDGTKGAKNAPKKETPAGTGWKKRAELAGGILAMLAVFCALLCTFLTGVDAVGSGDTEHVRNIWYYFDGVWEEIRNTRFQATDVLYKTTVYTPAVLGLLISIATIVTTVILSILAAVRFGKKTAGKSEKDYFGFALGAILSFVCGTALIVALNAMEVSGDGWNMYMLPNAAGLAGIILGIIFICGCVGCRIAIKGKSVLSYRSLAEKTFSLGAIVTLSVAVAFALKPMCWISESGMSVKWSFLRYAQEIEKGAFFEDMVVSDMFLIVSAIMQIAVAATAFTAIGKMMKNLVSENYKSGLKEAIALTVVSALLLAFSVAGLAICQNESETGIKFNYAYNIVQFVFAALMVAVAAVGKKICAKTSAEKKDESESA